MGRGFRGKESRGLSLSSYPSCAVCIPSSLPPHTCQHPVHTFPHPSCSWVIKPDKSSFPFCVFNVSCAPHTYNSSYITKPDEWGGAIELSIRCLPRPALPAFPTHADNPLTLSHTSACSWITKPDKWGGAIELSILCRHYQREIAAYDIRTQRCDVYGEGSGRVQLGFRRSGIRVC